MGFGLGGALSVEIYDRRWPTWAHYDRRCSDTSGALLLWMASCVIMNVDVNETNPSGYKLGCPVRLGLLEAITKTNHNKTQLVFVYQPKKFNLQNNEIEPKLNTQLHGSRMGRPRTPNRRGRAEGDNRTPRDTGAVCVTCRGEDRGPPLGAWVRRRSGESIAGFDRERDRVGF